MSDLLLQTLIVIIKDKSPPPKYLVLSVRVLYMGQIDLSEN